MEEAEDGAADVENLPEKKRTSRSLREHTMKGAARRTRRLCHRLLRARRRQEFSETSTIDEERIG